MVESTEPAGTASDAPAQPESLAVSLDTAPRPDGRAEHNQPQEEAAAAADVVTQDQNQTELVAAEELKPVSDTHADSRNPTSSITISDDVEVADVPQDLQKTTADDQLPADVPETAISSDEPSLADLRQKVLDQRGTKAQLPAGWDDNEPAAPEATSSSSSAAAAADAAEAIFSATTQVDSDSDSDSDTDSSSSSSSSSDSDSSDDEDDDDAKAKAEMVSDYDSDEDGPSRRKEDGEDGGRGPTTKNEMQQTKASKLFGQVPFQQVPEELVSTITPLGKIHGRVQEVLVIAQHPENLPGSKTSGPSTSIPGPSTSYATTYASHNERQGPILDAGSLVCFGDGQVLGLVFETFGSLLSPLYSVILPESPSENPELETKYAKDTPIFFLPSRSTILRPAELRAQQGKPSDASNVHDEEPNEWEIDQMDFSDDEEEAEFKRRLKEKRKGGAGKRNANEDPSAAQRGGKSKRGKGRGNGGAVSGAQQQTRGASTAAGGTPAHALPARPNWQLDEPAGGDAGALQYGEGTAADGGNVPDGRSGNLRPYNDDTVAAGDAPLQKAPPSAGLPPMPSSTAGTAAVQSQPPPPPSSSNGVPYQQQPRQAQPYHQQSSTAPAPPAGGAIHINPLFAHRFFGQGAPSPSSSPGGYQQQQHAQPYAAYQQHQQQQYGSGQQSYPAYPQHHHQQQQQQQQQQYLMQGAQAGWNGHEQYGAYPQHQQHSYGSQGGQYYPYQYQQHPQQQQQAWSPYNVQQAPQSAYPYPSGGQGHGQGQGQGSTYDPSRPS